jgi:hypothetical protein
VARGKTEQTEDIMKNHLTTLAKSLALAVVAIAVFSLSAGVARADEVTLNGSTSGTVTGVPPLVFAGNLFNGTTVAGIGSFSGATSLGTFFLNPSATQLLSGAFTLNITFLAPLGISGGQGAAFTAVIFGSVSPNINQGGVNIDFDNTPQVFTFSNAFNNGSFSLTLADLFVQTGQEAHVTAGFGGSQQANTVPEPATLLLLGTGLTGVAAKWHKRRKSAIPDPGPAI